MPIRQEPTLRTRVVCSGQRFLMSLVASGTCSRILSMSGDTSIWQPSRDLQDRVEKAECMNEVGGVRKDGSCKWKTSKVVVSLYKVCVRNVSE